MKDKTLNVVIVGGSLSGLMHGIVLRNLGHNVTILELNSLAAQKNLGAGIAAMEEVHTFIQNHDTTKTPHTVPSHSVQFLSRSLAVKSKWDVSVQTTSWTCLYYLLRANFDGLASDICPEPPIGASTATYKHGKNATGVEYVDGLVTVTFQDMETGGAGRLHADLVIAADGTSSKIRQILQPGLQRKYVGYIAWRGTALENEISEMTKAIFAEKTTLFVLDRGYVALYTIPSDSGTVAPGHRQFSWIWYTPCPSTSPDFRDTMTGIDGHTHRNTLPRGKFNPEKWTQQKYLAVKLLPAPFIELINKTTDPFVSAISDLEIGTPSFFDGKLLFVGDALATFRPHVAASTQQAAVDAGFVEGLVRGEMGVEEWEERVLGFARVTGLRSRLWGAYFMSGVWTVDFVLAAVRYGVAVVWQWIWKRWYGY